jgi:hypothetical protein
MPCPLTQKLQEAMMAMKQNHHKLLDVFLTVNYLTVPKTSKIFKAKMQITGEKYSPSVRNFDLSVGQILTMFF